MDETIKIVKVETRNLPVKLTQTELRERGDSLAAVIQDLNAEENKQVDVKAQMKARLAELDARKTQLAISISRREEYRDVAVDVLHDFGRKIVESVRQDTGETITSRPMTEAERQQPLPIPA
jgi:hypothetical protein